MALKGFDTLETYNDGTDVNRRHSSTAASFQLTGGPYNGPYIDPTTGVETTLVFNTNAAGDMMIVGFYCRRPTNNVHYFFVARDTAGTDQLSLAWSADRKINLFRGAGTTFLAQGPTTVPDGDWPFIEIKYDLRDASGLAEIYLNGLLEFTYSGDTLQSGASPAAPGNFYFRQGGSGAQEFGPFYWGDTSGGFNYLGPGQGAYLVPNSDEALMDWIASSGSNRSLMIDDDPDHDGDATFIRSSVPGSKSTFGLTGLPFTPASIFAIQDNFVGRKDLSEVRTVRQNKISGGTTTNGATRGLSSVYQEFLNTLQTVNPDTGLAWTMADIDALKLQMEHVA